MYEYLDRRYALALYEIAEKSNKVEEYIKSLEEINELIQGNEPHRGYDIGDRRKRNT